jgi:hypothetical protein
MQFVANGPDVPDELLQAHEEVEWFSFVVQAFHTLRAFQALRALLSEYMKRLGRP